MLDNLSYKLHTIQNIKPTITQLHTHFTQLYIGSVEEGGYHAHTHHLNHSFNRLYTKLAKQQTVRNTLK